jgi:hypothetical protein
MKRQKAEKTATTKSKAQGKLALKRNTLVDMKVKKDIRGGLNRPHTTCP